ncbi:Slit protein [Acrasis kona]|uniref:Slit protein n=1 Tax=Acrasis kona TaxID=1008807 RepID=A0AAW2YML2_9EUKA
MDDEVLNEFEQEDICVTEQISESYLNTCFESLSAPRKRRKLAKNSDFEDPVNYLLIDMYREDGSLPNKRLQTKSRMNKREDNLLQDNTKKSDKINNQVERFMMHVKAQNLDQYTI